MSTAPVIHGCIHDWGYEVQLAQLKVEAALGYLSAAAVTQDPGVRRANLDAARGYVDEFEAQVHRMQAAAVAIASERTTAAAKKATRKGARRDA